MGLFKKSRPSRSPADTALAEFDRLITDFPTADASHRSMEIGVLRSARGGWQGRTVATGTVEEIRRVLTANLEQEARRPGFSDVLVLPFADDRHLQVQVLLQVGGAHRGGGGVYRVWRTAEGAALFPKSDDATLAGARTEAVGA